MKAKFEIGTVINFNGNEEIIKVSTKNFSTNVISYVLESGISVTESDLLNGIEEKTDLGDSVTESDLLRKKYAELFGKEVAVAYKNNLEWISSKIKEEEEKRELAKNSNNIGTGDIDKNVGEYTWLELSVMDIVSLETVIQVKELDIEIQDFANIEELREKVATLLGITIQ